MTDLNLKKYRIILIVLIFLFGTVGNIFNGNHQVATTSFALGLLVAFWLTFRFKI